MVIGSVSFDGSGLNALDEAPMLVWISYVNGSYGSYTVSFGLGCSTMEVNC